MKKLISATVLSLALMAGVAQADVITVPTTVPYVTAPVAVVNGVVGSVLNYVPLVFHFLNPRLGPCTDYLGNAYPADACAKYFRDVK